MKKLLCSVLVCSLVLFSPSASFADASKEKFLNYFDLSQETKPEGLVTGKIKFSVFGNQQNPLKKGTLAMRLKGNIKGDNGEMTMALKASMLVEKFDILFDSSFNALFDQKVIDQEVYTKISNAKVILSSDVQSANEDITEDVFPLDIQDKWFLGQSFSDIINPNQAEEKVIPSDFGKNLIKDLALYLDRPESEVNQILSSSLLVRERKTGNSYTTFKVSIDGKKLLDFVPESDNSEIIKLVLSNVKIKAVFRYRHILEDFDYIAFRASVKNVPAFRYGKVRGVIRFIPQEVSDIVPPIIEQ